ncbi:hypothetical protein [Rodentibacter pneumotropicus]|uniref:Uncharacterized protein n=1 Tax=Rodentibacter pneumotropicus TaxID=758 RepID=A0A4S2Q330_9PAST|nr:hypothetical protein [Rodentibacter pneumotropicus]THA10962.1 hypothetical protein D3M76_11620 [Rodentibacter pneumotropicus]
MSCGCLKPRCGSQPITQFWCDNDGRDVEFISLTEFLPRVTLIAKGVPDDVALEYLRQSAQTLARDSRLLKRELRLDVQAGVRDYYLGNGDHEQVHYVDNIELKSGQISPCFCKDAFDFEPNDKIILHKTPKADRENQLYVRYFAMPTQNACEVDKLLFDRYHDVVVNGALANLLLMRQYAFADPQMAMFYETRFKQGIAQAKIDVMQRFETGGHSIAYKGRI